MAVLPSPVALSLKRPAGILPARRAEAQTGDVQPDRLPLGGGAGSAVIRHRRSDGTTEPRLVSAGRTGTGGYFIETSATSLRFVVIGAGRLGASLALALRAQGASLLGFTAHSPAGRAQAEAYLGGRASASVADLVSLGPDLYLIAVPDQSLPEVATELAAHLPRPAAGGGAAVRPGGGAGSHPGGVAVAHTGAIVVAHTSGATSVGVLQPCEQAGAETLVFHPLQTFSDPHTGSARFAGAAVAITPSANRPDSPAAARGFALARLLGARPFLLPDDKRGLYHAAATFACNYLVTLEHHAEQLFVQAGLPPDEALSLFLPLVRATLDNVAAQGTVEALTGPLSRGDTRTVADHLAILAKEAPHLCPLYRALGVATLDLVRARQEVAPPIIAELAGLLTTVAPPSDQRAPQPGA